MKIMTLEELKQHYLENTQKEKLNKISNNTIINLIDYVKETTENAENKKIIVNAFSTQGLASRGDVAECLIKMLFINDDLFYKTEHGPDLVLNGVNYEIKCATPRGYASYDPKQDLSHLIFITKKGLYQVENGKDYLIFNPDGTRIKDFVINENVKVIKKF